MDTLSDEEAITLALLHGCEFYNPYQGAWYVHKRIPQHPLEETRPQHQQDDPIPWSSKEELAKDYCKFYKLGTYGGNTREH